MLRIISFPIKDQMGLIFMLFQAIGFSLSWVNLLFGALKTFYLGLSAMDFYKDIFYD